jgi:hypothetical protein
VLVKDGNALDRDREQLKREVEEQRVKDYVDNIEAHRVYVDGNDTANMASQLGQAMHSDQLNALLKRLYPSIKICYPPLQPHLCACYSHIPENPYNSAEALISIYPHGIVPEWTLFSKITKDVPDPNCTHISALDMPKAEDTEALRPGFKRVEIGDQVVMHGWRTVLKRMVEARLVTPDEVEREVGAGDRLSWASGMGRRTGSQF